MHDRQLLCQAQPARVGGGVEGGQVGEDIYKLYIIKGSSLELREDIKIKNTLQFGHCPNVGGGEVYPCPNFFDTFLTN